ncbi:MAG TPA: agmatinase [Alphaproteobacteria bacterium]
MADQGDRFQPIAGTVLPRFAGIATFMRLPHVPVEEAAGEVDIGFVGVPWDGGTTNRPGARHGPRQMRDASTMMRKVHHATRIKPYELCRCADLGDVPVNPINVADTLGRVERFFDQVAAAAITPITAGGDHLVTLPILRALARARPVGLVHFDAHTDTWDRYFGDERYTHGTPFRRAVEEGLLEPTRMIQIGIRGSMNADDEKDWTGAQGIRVIEIEEYAELGPRKVVEEARRIVGDGPVYVSFDVDALDPVYAPGTGTPEIGGLSTFDCQVMLRGLRGLDLVGGDVVEVSPPFDPSGNTALVGVTMMFEMLCLFAEAIAARRG